MQRQGYPAQKVLAEALGFARATVSNFLIKGRESNEPCHTSWVFALDISPDGQRLTTGSADQTACLWDRQAGRCLTILTDHKKSNCSTLTALQTLGEKLRDKE